MKKRGSILELSLFYIVSSFLLYVACISLTTSATRPSSLPIVLPLGFFSNTVFILKIIVWASFEEFLYRVYFPSKLKKFFLLPQHTDFPSSFRLLCVCLLPHLLFALAHSYLGFSNLLFAFFASMFLRTIYTHSQQTKGAPRRFIIICSLHSCYNIFVLYLTSS